MNKISFLFVFVIIVMFAGCDSVNEPLSSAGTPASTTGSKTTLAKRNNWNNDGHTQYCDRDHSRNEDCNSREGDHEDNCDGYHSYSERCNHDRQHSSGCNKHHDYDEPCNGGQTTSTCDADGIVTLWAGKSDNVGTVTVTQNLYQIFITYTTSGSWKLKETHLDVSTQKYSERGTPGQYAYQATHGAGITTYTYSINKTWASGTTLYFLAHAVVGKYSNQQCGSTQTAFGGTVVIPRNGSWFATFCASVKGTPPPTYSISGFTFVDANSNGLKDAGEAVLSNITVSLSNGGTAVSSSTGTYTFTGLNAGSYTVSAPSVSGYTQSTASSVPVTITNANASANFGYVLIPPTYSISGIVFNDTNLNGIQDTGEPGIAGAVVKLNATTSVTTDANGNYIFANLNSGTYTVAPDAIVNLNLTTPSPLTIVLTNTNATGTFGFAQYSIPDLMREAVK